MARRFLIKSPVSSVLSYGAIGCLFLFIVTGQVAKAQSVWDGGGSGVGTSWNSNTNWVGDTLPAAGANLLFDNRTGSGTLVTPMSVSSTRTVGTITFDNVNSKLPATLNIDTNGSGGSTARTLTINSGITLANTTTAVTFNATNNGTLSIALGGNISLVTSSTSTLTLNPIISGSGFGITKSGTGTVILNAQNTYSGTTTVSGGTLVLGNATNTLSNTGAVVVNGGTLSIGANSDTVGAVTLTSGSITGTGGTLTAASFGVESGSVSAILGGAGSALTKSTNAVVTLTGANSYTGATTVNGGTLIVDGSIAAASTVSVNATGNLGGSGTVNGDVNVVGGEVAPGPNGVAASTLTVDQNFSLDSASTITFDLVGNNTTVGSSINDLITGVNNLTLDGTLNINEIGAGSFLSAMAGDTWRIFNYTGVLNNLGLNLGSTPSVAGGLTFVVDTSTAGQVNLLLQAAAIPEPGSIALLSGLSLFGMFVARRRKWTRRTGGSR